MKDMLCGEYDILRFGDRITHATVSKYYILMYDIMNGKTDVMMLKMMNNSCVVIDVLCVLL